LPELLLLLLLLLLRVELLLFVLLERMRSLLLVNRVASRSVDGLLTSSVLPWAIRTCRPQVRLMSRKTIKNGGKRYKFKPKRAAKKRFSLTASGKVKTGKSGRRHLAQAISGKRGNNLAKTGYVRETMAKNVRRMLVNHS
jgi:large subunit ribosomal protein L35